MEQALPDPSQPPPPAQSPQASFPYVHKDAGPAKGLETGAFFAIIQRLEQLFPDMPPFGGTQDPSRERIRFRANPSLGYPAREVERFVWNEDEKRLDVIVNFLGLQGPSSPLPPFFTEEVIDDAGDGGVLGTFFDLFNHRLVSLLVRIQKHQRHYLRYDGGGGDPISLAVASLMGLLPAAAEGQRVALMPYVGLLSCYSLSASIIATIIGHCTNLPVRIDEFVERTVTIPAQSRSNLGDAPPQLGVDFIVGSDVQDHVGKFRVVIGPLDRATFARVLPDQPLFADVIRLVELALRDPLAFDIRLELEKGAPFAFVMGEGRLGWNMWLAPPDDASGHADFAGDRFAEAM